jgi:hypothetical protein
LEWKLRRIDSLIDKLLIGCLTNLKAGYGKLIENRKMQRMLPVTIEKGIPG